MNRSDGGIVRLVVYRRERSERKMDRFGLQACRSMLQSRPQQLCLMDPSPPGLYPLFHSTPHPRLFPNDSSTTSSPPCLHYDSHPLPRLNYCCSPWESSITLPPCSVIIKQVYELRPVPDCIEEPSSAVFMRLRAFVRTLELTHCWLWWHFNRKSFQS